MVQWLGLSTFTARAWGSIPGQGTKISQAALLSQKKKKVWLSPVHWSDEASGEEGAGELHTWLGFKLGVLKPHSPSSSRV